MAMQLAIPPSVAGKGVSFVGLSPVAIATILDHHMRKNNQEFVLGTLLGVRRDGEILVKSAIGVPFVRNSGSDGNSEDDDGLSLNNAYLQGMLELHARVAPREVVVGSYITQPQFQALTGPLHRFLTMNAGSLPTVLLTLDPENLDFSAFSTRQIGLGTPAVTQDNGNIVKAAVSPGVLFSPVTSSIVVDEDLGPAMEVLQTESEFEIPLNSPLKQIQSSLDDVKGLADQVIGYLKGVASGEVKPDPRIGAALAQTLKAYPLTSDIVQSFNSQITDVLMVSYLASVVKAETEISGRLNLLM